MAYEQPELGFELNALEPHLDEETLRIHFGKHHVTYITKFNDAVKGSSLDSKELEEILKNLGSIPEEIKTAVINHGGGSWNHSFFWKCLIPTRDFKEISGDIKSAIEAKWGSFEKFKEEFSSTAATVFGSGWAWLVKNENGELEIVKTQNQDSPLSKGQKPLLVLDVWEHAYYLKYRNVRPSFIEAWWNVVNWEFVESQFRK